MNADVTTLRWTDPEGHTWPLTGYRCRLCGLPLDVALIRARFDTHGEEDL